MRQKNTEPRPRILDLFCGAGGAAMGYHRAGFDVVGVDLEAQPNYPFEFIQADALTFFAEHGREFAAVHASPPCQVFAEVANSRKRTDHPELLTPTRAALIASGLPYVIENVPTAPMPTSVLLCGATFGLPIIRHRRFELHPDPVIVPSLCRQIRHGRGVTHGPGFYPYARKKWRPAWREHVIPVVWPWMTLEEAGQAIPPAYTEFLGEQLLEHIASAAA